ncbi:MAG: hypothetical protein IJX78_06005 [Bacilli bacterium]|nr:hypothetical protein [Bacilli bacterium]
MAEQTKAYLSNNGEYTTFTFGGRTLTFLTSKSLERYTSIKKWDNGFLVVMAKYSTRATEEEEYIDLIPILENLYMDAESFLTPIKQVEIRYV